VKLLSCSFWSGSDSGHNVQALRPWDASYKERLEEIRSVTHRSGTDWHCTVQDRDRIWWNYCSIFFTVLGMEHAKHFSAILGYASFAGPNCIDGPTLWKMFLRKIPPLCLKNTIAMSKFFVSLPKWFFFHSVIEWESSTLGQSKNRCQHPNKKSFVTVELIQH
jgi:hypothetical protein